MQIEKTIDLRDKFISFTRSNKDIIKEIKKEAEKENININDSNFHEWFIFEKTFNSTSYACRKEKGTHKGVNNLQSTIRRYKKQNKECYFLKTDFSKYFYSIGSKLLKLKVSKKITDRKTLRLLFQFIDEVGLKIGFLSSQLLANVYGHIFDTFIKTKLKIKHYFRYMDDTVMLSTSKSELRRVQKILQKFSGIFMKLRFSKWFIEKVDVQFINFLGYRIKSDYKLIRKDKQN